MCNYVYLYDTLTFCTFHADFLFDYHSNLYEVIL